MTTLTDNMIYEYFNIIRNITCRKFLGNYIIWLKVGKPNALTDSQELTSPQLTVILLVLTFSTSDVTITWQLNDI